jgi:aspartate/methionine/tyrosine aminotransferase
MFSKRFIWREDDNALTRATDARRAAGAPVADLTLSNPARAGFAWPPDALARALAAPENRLYNPDPKGLPAAREACAAYYRAHGAAISPAQIHLCASTSEGYSWALKLLTNPGDDVLVPAPSYPLLQFLAGMENVTTTPYPLRLDAATGLWRVDAAALARAVTPRTRLLFCVSPNNPTGTVTADADHAALLDIARRHRLAILADEVFLDFGANARALHSRAGCTEVPFLALGGMSKTALLPQVKLAWIATSGPPEWLANALKHLDLIADTYLSVNTPAQHAAHDFFNTGATLRAALTARVERNEAALRTWCSEAAHRPRLLRREAGWTAILALPRGVDEEAATLDLLKRGGALVHPGYFYDIAPDAGAHWVLSLITPEDSLAAALPRLEETLLRL